MRPTKLTVQGLTAFRKPVEIDFRDLDLFAITGPTGAGKSSLVDAISYALFGQVTDLLREKSWVPTSLRVMDGRLDDVFQNLTVGESTPTA